MANSFKNAAISATTSYQTLYTAPSLSEVVVLSLLVTNKTSNVMGVTFRFNDSSAAASFQMLQNVQIPPNTSLELMQGQKYILEAGDSYSVLAEADTSIDIVMGVMEKT